MYNLYQTKSEGADFWNSLLKLLVNRNQKANEDGGSPLALLS